MGIATLRTTDGTTSTAQVVGSECSSLQSHNVARRPTLGHGLRPTSSNDSRIPPRGPIAFESIPNPLTPSRPSTTLDKDHLAPPKYRFFASCSGNNTKVFLFKPNGELLSQGWWTGGSCGFKGANRKTHEAGYQCAVRAFKRLEELVEEKGPIALSLQFAGYGKGRDAIQNVFLTSEAEKIRPLVVEVEDRTKIKIGGTRAKKARRI
ncbi:mitochondrial ribosomal protein subunit S18 [Melanogaster broomeanus]|nr:mitochondrial ribosomal protein subunit S18 [Melanogaster broomeanus]